MDFAEISRESCSILFLQTWRTASALPPDSGSTRAWESPTRTTRSARTWPAFRLAVQTLTIHRYIFLILYDDFFQTSDTINKIYVAGYSVSIVFLAVATFIFIHFRFVNRRQVVSLFKGRDLSILAKRRILAFKICERSFISGSLPQSSGS